MIGLDEIKFVIQFVIGLWLFYCFVEIMLDYDVNELQRKADKFERLMRWVQ